MQRTPVITSIVILQIQMQVATAGVMLFLKKCIAENKSDFFGVLNNALRRD